MKLISKIVKYLLVALLLLSCDSVYALNRMTLVSEMVVFVSVVLLILKVANEKKITIRIEKKRLVCVIVYLLLLLLCSITMRNADVRYYVRFIVIIPLFILMVSLSKNDIKELYDILGNVIYFMCLSSLLLFIMGPQLKIIPMTNTIKTFWGWSRSYLNYNYLLLTEKARGGLGSYISYRNLSIYPEGPFSSLVFTLGLGVELFIRERPSIHRIIIHIIGVFTTISASGMVLTAVLISIWLFLNNETEVILLLKKGFIRFIFALVMVVVSYYLIRLVLEEKRTFDIGNYNSHINAFSNGMSAFLKEPIHGYGYMYPFDLGNSTSGLFKVMVYGGVPFLLIYIFPLAVGFKRSISAKDFKYSAFIALVAALLLLVVWQNSLLLLLLLIVFLLYEPINDLKT